jgi:hypothetical protein
MPPWPSLAVAGVVGVLVVVLTWLLGPGALGIVATVQGTSVSAQVTVPTQCEVGTSHEAVAFTLNGQNRFGTLSACGHDKGEHVDIVIPQGSSDTGAIAVDSADTASGSTDLRGPLGLALVALSCIAGGLYAFLVLRDPPPRPVLI